MYTYMYSFVPLVAVAAANCVNIPLMRQQEVKDGIMIQTNAGEDVGLSGNAAVSAISQVLHMYNYHSTRITTRSTTNT